METYSLELDKKKSSIMYKDTGKVLFYKHMRKSDNLFFKHKRAERKLKKW